MSQLDKLSEIEKMVNILRMLEGSEAFAIRGENFDAEWAKLTNMLRVSIADLETPSKGLTFEQLSEMLPVTPNLSLAEATRRREILRLSLEKQAIGSSVLTAENFEEFFNNWYADTSLKTDIEIAEAKYEASKAKKSPTGSRKIKTTSIKS